MPGLEIAYCKPGGGGWWTLHHMVNLASALLEAPVTTLNSNSGFFNHLMMPTLRRRRDAGKPDLLLIAARPRQLVMLSELPDWRNRYNRVAAWVIDSFWTDRLPARGVRGQFDQLWVVTGNDAEEYQRRTGVPTGFLGIGSDALHFGTMAAEKDIDLMRIGRQPAAWDDDEATQRDCEAAGIRFQGRTPFVDDPIGNIRSNAGYFARSKFVMAHSNLVDKSDYTHPTKEYITERWTDALSAGATVAGMPPLTDWAVKEELWPGALVEVSATDRHRGIDQLKEALADWTPEQARSNRRLALERLDWRWRIAEIARFLGRETPTLSREMGELRAAIASV